jgi:hypothetical protein
MKWLTAADGPVQDWILVTVDGISYSVHSKRAEIHCEATDAAELHLLMTSDKHRRNLADRAALAQREAGSWSSERQDSWNIHAGGKKLRFAWDGSIPSAEKKARVITASSLEDIAQRKFNKPYSNLNPQEKAQVADEMHSQQNMAPAAPVPPSFAPPAAPLAPGQSAKNINWFVKADNPDFKEEGPDAENPKDQKANDDEPVKKDDKKTPPFGKKDDKDKGDKKDEKKDDSKKEKEPKKDSPKKDAPKKDGPSKSDEKKDVKMAEELVKELEDLIKNEEKEGEGGPHLEALRNALEELKKFMGEEKDELDMPGMPPSGPAGPGIPMKIDMKPMPLKGPNPGPGMNMDAPAMPFASWTDENTTGFHERDSVWRKADMGIVESIGFEPGRVVAIGNGKVIVDWGDDEVLSEERPEDLVLATAASGEQGLFDESSTNPEVVEESLEQSPEEIKAEIESVLSKTSLRDLLNVTSTSDGSNPNALVHVGTGMEGEYVAKGSDGRLLVRVAGEEFFVWPYEVRFVNAQEEK